MNSASLAQLADEAEQRRAGDSSSLNKKRRRGLAEAPSTATGDARDGDIDPASAAARIAKLEAELALLRSVAKKAKPTTEPATD